MPKFELPKSIEARKLNRRSGLPVDQHWVSIPFGAVLDIAGTDRNLVKFNYLNELYHSPDDVLKKALSAMPDALADPKPGESAPTAVPASTASNGPEAAAPAQLVWERITSAGGVQTVWRTPVPGGWLVATGEGGLTFCPDAQHNWNGASDQS